MEFWKNILNKLENKQNVYLLTVVENIGSSPGRQGFKMFVSEDDTIFGSIGGGIMEYQFVEKVKKDLQTNNLQVFFKRQVHQGKAKDSSGMICSGEQTVVFHPLNNKDLATIQHIVSTLKNNKKGVIDFVKEGITFSENKLDKQFVFKNTKNWSFKELLGYKETFYIIGGGHVGLATSKIARFLNFYVVILDNRKNLNTLENNKYAHEKQVVAYTEIEKYIIPNSFVAIMTSKFVEDKLILSKLIHLQHQFLGVLGSKSKMKTMLTSFRKEGVSKEVISKIYTPIGISIKSQTPEEIAVSIAAQVVQVKNKNL